jgi:hypothetical protein
MHVVADRLTYDASSIDWHKLRHYARRVAKETKLPPSLPITYAKVVEEDVEIQYPGFLGFFARTKTERRDVRKMIEAVGPHWPLDQRSWDYSLFVKTQNGSEKDERERVREVIALTPKGDLVYVEVRTEMAQGRGPLYTWTTERITHTTEPVAESHIIRMDFQRKSRSRFRRGRYGEQYTDDRERGDRLITHAKGVGASLALRDILGGRPSRGLR